MQQLGNGLDVPIGELRFRMAKVRAELDHLPIRVEPLAVPADDRVHREGVPQIVDARTTPVLAVPLRLPEAERLADSCEVVTCAAVGRTFAALNQEERAWCRPQQAGAFGSVRAKSSDGAQR